MWPELTADCRLIGFSEDKEVREGAVPIWRQLRQEVLAELDFEPSINAANIGVAVDDGVVILSGLGSYAEKSAAAQAARRVRRVRAIARRSRSDIRTTRRRRMTKSRSGRSASSNGTR
jgi:hypothetical protein